MPKYRVTLQTVASYTAEFTATDEDAAVDMAIGEAPALCHSCSDIDLGEWGTDGFTAAPETPELVEDEGADE